jgi:hypothetical protein
LASSSNHISNCFRRLLWQPEEKWCHFKTFLVNPDLAAHCICFSLRSASRVSEKHYFNFNVHCERLRKEAFSICQVEVSWF